MYPSLGPLYILSWTQRSDYLACWLLLPESVFRGRLATTWRIVLEHDQDSARRLCWIYLAQASGARDAPRMEVESGPMPEVVSKSEDRAVIASAA